MAAWIDLTNMVFGRLIVIDYLYSERGSLRNVHYWNCRCSCGNTKVVKGMYLLRGHVKSCGCLQENNVCLTRNLVGQKFGKLQVLEITNERDRARGIKWKCICECGRIRLVTSSRLVHGKTKSCGCSKRKDNKSSQKNKVFLVYRRSAEKRGYEFLLTKEQVISFFDKECYYCGAPPSNVARSSNKGILEDWKEKSKLLYNGIDRMDNKVGYTLDNCVPCCSLCNQMKMDESIEKFLNKIKLIYERRIK